jgi:phosphate/sulfate permease
MICSFSDIVGWILVAPIIIFVVGMFFYSVSRLFVKDKEERASNWLMAIIVIIVFIICFVVVKNHW